MWTWIEDMAGSLETPFNPGPSYFPASLLIWETSIGSECLGLRASSGRPVPAKLQCVEDARGHKSPESRVANIPP